MVRVYDTTVNDIKETDSYHDRDDIRKHSYHDRDDIRKHSYHDRDDIRNTLTMTKKTSRKQCFPDTTVL